MRISSSLDQALETVRSGGILAYPTEAVFGLGCNPGSLSAVQRILGIKQRPADKGLILIGSSLNQFDAYLAPLDDLILARIEPGWPGPVTWLLPVRPEVSPLLRGNHDKIAVRISNHPDCQYLCQRLGHPLVSTSANPNGQLPARSAREAQSYFGAQIDFYLDRNTGKLEKPTEIRNALTNDIVRSG
ncbi:MAG: Sua5/YciO/YrdC/YwlC family protein [Thiothrix sp.]|nr:Sua5/YciO/YrdC/YwlC family protein [Thiothrix sp.]HPQ96281.1 Sua5/YciO/YrdC/YwlC family protein [Thiolinea sp.]